VRRIFGLALTALLVIFVVSGCTWAYFGSVESGAQGDGVSFCVIYYAGSDREWRQLCRVPSGRGLVISVHGGSRASFEEA
jgi:hypothetical protein